MALLVTVNAGNTRVFLLRSKSSAFEFGDGFGGSLGGVEPSRVPFFGNGGGLVAGNSIETRSSSASSCFSSSPSCCACFRRCCRINGDCSSDCSNNKLFDSGGRSAADFVGATAAEVQGASAAFC